MQELKKNSLPYPQPTARSRPKGTRCANANTPLYPYPPLVFVSNHKGATKPVLRGREHLGVRRTGEVLLSASLLQRTARLKYC